MVMAKLYPYINAFTGDVQILPKNEGNKLNEDWHRGKLAKNEKGEKVFRFQIATNVIDKNGKPQSGVAVVDIQEVKSEEVDDGDQRPE